MKISAFLGLVVASAHFLSMTTTCNPKTKVGVCASKTAVGDCNWEYTAASHGAHVNVRGVADNEVAQICGPGSFVFSPMTCEPPSNVGSHFAYRAETFTCEANQTCDCRTVTLGHFANCFAVSC
eukprot:GEMP01114212.1.p1 GENE.GEMP01114212.1~~GEMP01114212.1.p1  ORF type:complete len:124 (+),score=18.18 GEMP01114212.1:45-416(+)